MRVVSRPRPVLLVATIAAVALCGGCDHSFPDVPLLGELSGHVFYKGKAHAGMSRASVQVAAFASFPPQGPPHAAHIIEAPDFSKPEGVPYKLDGLDDHSYYLVAGLIDLDHQQATRTGSTGSYPDVCALRKPSGSVTIKGGAPQEKLDITLYDNDGNDDPCSKLEPSSCPAAGQATLIFEVTDVDKVGAKGRDRLSFAIFESWPATGVPVAFGLVPADGSKTPVRWVNNSVKPGAYAVFVCFDRGANNLIGCGSEDIELVYNEGKTVALTAGSVVTVRASLSTKASQPAEVARASDLGCP